jgi:serine/threonine-protein kinase RsbW
VDPLEPLLLVVPSTLEAARAATEKVVALCDRLDEQERALYGTAVMEWLVNVVKHSYRQVADGEITLRAVVGAEAIELMIEDTGTGMASWEFEAAPACVSFDESDLAGLPESGMGLAIIKSVMDRVWYQSDCGIHRLTAVKRWQR